MADAASLPSLKDAPLPPAFAAFAEPPALPPRFGASHDQEFASIESTVAATARGRWFLAEYARRVRARDHAPLIAALERIEKRLADGVNLDALAQAQGGRGAEGFSTLAGVKAALQAALRLPEDFVTRVSAPVNALPKATAPRRRAHVGPPPPSFLHREIGQAKAGASASAQASAQASAPASSAPLASFAPEAIAENPELEDALAQIAEAAAAAAAIARAALAGEADAPRRDAKRKLTAPAADEERPAPSRKRPPAPLVSAQPVSAPPSEPPSEPLAEPHEAA